MILLGRVTQFLLQLEMLSFSVKDEASKLNGGMNHGSGISNPVTI